MLGQLAGQEQPDGGLISREPLRGDGRPTEKTNKTPHIDSPFVVVCQLASLCSNSLEEVVDKRVHDGHGLRGHTSVGMHLLQHLVVIKTVNIIHDHRIIVSTL